MRPRQWTKNAFLFAALVFDGKLFHLPDFLRTSGRVRAVLSHFQCSLHFQRPAGCGSRPPAPDKEKPSNRLGEIACSRCPRSGHDPELLAIALGYLLAWQFALTILVYFAMMLVYSKWLKHVPILDVLILAAGFVLRVHAGTTLITVERFSPWLYVLMTLLALYLGFGKRRAELALLAEQRYLPSAAPQSA